MIFLAAAVALLLMTALLEPFFVRLRKDVLPGSKNLSGLKIAFLSDAHCAGELSLLRLSRAADRLSAKKPDVLILGGDYADSPEYAARALTLLASVNAPLGVFAVRGNHDYYYNLDQVMKGLPIKLLDNSGIAVDYHGGELFIGGLADRNRDTPDCNAALSGSEGADMTVLVSHSPRSINCAAKGKKADFALCGHTHGGQVTVFGLYSPLADRPMPAYKPQWLKVSGVPTLYSNGLGTTFVPLRFMAPPQIHIIEITGDAAVSPRA